MPKSQPRTSDRYNATKNRNASAYTEIIKDETIYGNVAQQVATLGPQEKDDGSIYYGPIYLNPDDGCMTHVDTYSLWYEAADGRQYCLDMCGNPIYKDGIYSGATRVSDQSNVDINDMSFASLSAQTTDGSGGTIDSQTIDELLAKIDANTASINTNTGLISNLSGFTTEYDAKLLTLSGDIVNVSDDLSSFETTTNMRFGNIDSSINVLSSRININIEDISGVKSKAESNRVSIDLIGSRILVDEDKIRDISAQVIAVDYALSSFESAVGLEYLTYSFTTQNVNNDGQVPVAGNVLLNGSNISITSPTPVTLQPPFFDVDLNLLTTYDGYNGKKVDMTKNLTIAWTNTLYDTFIVVGTEVNGTGPAMFPPSSTVTFLRVSNTVSQISSDTANNTTRLNNLIAGSTETIADLASDISSVTATANADNTRLTNLIAGSTETIADLASDISSVTATANADNTRLTNLIAGSTKTIADLASDISSVTATANADNTRLTNLIAGSTETIADLVSDISANASAIEALQTNSGNGQITGDLVIKSGYAIEYLGDTAPTNTTNRLYPVNGVMYYDGSPIGNEVSLIMDISASLDELIDTVQNISTLVNQNTESIETLTSDVNTLKSTISSSLSGIITLTENTKYLEFLMQFGTIGAIRGSYYLNGVEQNNSDEARSVLPPFYDVCGNLITTYQGIHNITGQLVNIDLTKPLVISTDGFEGTFYILGTAINEQAGTASFLPGSEVILYRPISTTYNYVMTPSSSQQTALNSQIGIDSFEFKPTLLTSSESTTTTGLAMSILRSGQSSSRLTTRSSLQAQQLQAENQALKERLASVESSLNMITSSFRIRRPDTKVGMSWR